IEPLIYDPIANSREVKQYYNLELCSEDDISALDAIIFAVSHKEFMEYTKDEIDSLFGEGKKVIIDVKGIFDRKTFESSEYIYWRL
ncbi:MAG: nucleotide sugar dehydrogenase, partial [Clostridia bacterium]|nr:nucleotide sugar dehydrogenase [Clostridia bacterium]